MVIYQLGSICRHGHTANLNLPACRPQPAILHPCIDVVDDLIVILGRILVGLQRGRRGSISLTDTRST